MSPNKKITLHKETLQFSSLSCWCWFLCGLLFLRRNEENIILLFSYLIKNELIVMFIYYILCFVIYITFGYFCLFLYTFAITERENILFPIIATYPAIPFFLWYGGIYDFLNGGYNFLSLFSDEKNLTSLKKILINCNY